MIFNKNILILALIFTYPVGDVITFHEKEKDVNYTFSQTDSSYSFRGIITVKANPDCLLNICFKYNHIKALAPDAEVVLLDQGSNWNKISYTYQKFIYFENTSVWYRTMDKEKQKVNFTLISSENNNTIMPNMISSNGYYKIHKKGSQYIIEYHQECQLSKTSLTKIYLNRVKKEAISFIHWFSDYANKTCTKSD